MADEVGKVDPKTQAFREYQEHEKLLQSGHTVIIFNQTGNALLMPQVENFVEKGEILTFSFYDENVKKRRNVVFFIKNISGYSYL